MIENMSTTSSSPSMPSTSSPVIESSICSAGGPNSSASLTNNKLTIRDYLRNFEHSIECTESNCSTAKCKTFKRLIGHFKQCARLGQCEYCRWLLQVLIVHAKWCEKPPHECPVPFCYAIKLKINEREIFNHRVESIKEFVRSGCDLLMDKLTSSSVQTTTCHECSGGKRKLDQEEEYEEDTEPTSDTDKKHQRTALLERINQINSQRPVIMGDQFEKDIRQAIVKFIVETSQQRLMAIDSPPHGSPVDKNRFIQVALYAIKQERSLLAKCTSTDDYLYLMTDLLYRIQTELDLKIKTNKTVSQVGTQTDLENRDDHVEGRSDCKKPRVSE